VATSRTAFFDERELWYRRAMKLLSFVALVSLATFGCGSNQPGHDAGTGGTPACAADGGGGAMGGAAGNLATGGSGGASATGGNGGDAGGSGTAGSAGSSGLAGHGGSKSCSPFPPDAVVNCRFTDGCTGKPALLFCDTSNGSWACPPLFGTSTCADSKCNLFYPETCTCDPLTGRVSCGTTPGPQDAGAPDADAGSCPAPGQDGSVLGCVWEGCSTDRASAPTCDHGDWFCGPKMIDISKCAPSH